MRTIAIDPFSRLSYPENPAQKYSFSLTNNNHLIIQYPCCNFDLLIIYLINSIEFFIKIWTNFDIRNQTLDKFVLKKPKKFLWINWILNNLMFLLVFVVLEHGFFSTCHHIMALFRNARWNPLHSNQIEDYSQIERQLWI